MPSDDLRKKYKDLLDTIKLYPKQFKQAWYEVQAIDFPDDYKDILNIVVFGMGGSALGARIADSLIADRLLVPLEIFTGFEVPKYAYKRTLCVASSYSGNTEETINATLNVIDRQCKVFGITTGGELGRLLNEKDIPRYIIDPKYNPSKQPRNALGYAFGGFISMLSKLNIVDITNNEVNNSLAEFENIISNTQSDSEIKEKIKLVSHNLTNKIPVLVASEHLLGAAYAIKNQLNESSKTFSVLFDLPELNHHLMEGLVHPTELGGILHFIFIESDLYHDRVVKRYPITEDVVDKNNIAYSTYKIQSTTKLSQVFELLAFGSLTALTTSENLGVDPSIIPWVDYFKEKISV